MPHAPTPVDTSHDKTSLLQDNCSSISNESGNQRSITGSQLSEERCLSAPHAPTPVVTSKKLCLLPKGFSVSSSTNNSGKLTKSQKRKLRRHNNFHSKRKIKAINRKIEILSRRIDFVKSKLDTYNEKIDDIETRFSSLSITKRFPKEYSFLAKYHDEKDFYQIMYDKFRHFLSQIQIDTNMTLGRLPRIKLQLNTSDNKSSKRIKLTRNANKSASLAISTTARNDSLRSLDDNRSSSDEDFNINEADVANSKNDNSEIELKQQNHLIHPNIRQLMLISYLQLRIV